MLEQYLQNVIRIFRQYRQMGEDTFSQIKEEQLFVQYNESSNSIAIIVHHMGGNMLSRWTDFLTSDGEKEWRHRDEEFEDTIHTKEEVIKLWNKAWDCFLNTLTSLRPDDLQSTVYIRGEPHNVMEAINRQLAHYSYHIGQIVFLGKMLCGGGWKSLSIPKGDSETFNREMFLKNK